MRLILLTLCVLLMPVPGFAQSHTIAYRDGHGKVHSYAVDKLPVRAPAPADAVATLQSGGIAFTVTYMDQADHTGVGFDDPTSGSQRRATVQAVLGYIGSVLNESGACTILWDDSTTSGDLSLGGELAHAGSFFETIDGFTNGLAFENIKTGSNPAPSSPNIEGQVDFGFPWNNGLRAPGPGEVDLYSVLLHEITHGLGIESLANPDGTSAFAVTDHANTFTVWDSLLYTGSGTQLWTGAGQFNGTASDLVGGSGGILFRGAQATLALGTFPRVYAPNPYEDGSSLSHWDDATFPTNPPVMSHAITNGIEKRTYRNFEIGALQDLGYAIQTAAMSAARDWQRWR